MPTEDGVGCSSVGEGVCEDGSEEESVMGGERGDARRFAGRNMLGMPCVRCAPGCTRSTRRPKGASSVESDSPYACTAALDAEYAPVICAQEKGCE